MSVVEGDEKKPPNKLLKMLGIKLSQDEMPVDDVLVEDEPVCDELSLIVKPTIIDVNIAPNKTPIETKLQRLAYANC